MKRYFIDLAFRGTNYHGWQRQPNAVTVQSVLEESMRRITGEPIAVTGAGRTDTGVHARLFTAHFDSDHTLAERPGDFIFRLNAVLPADIAVKDLYAVIPEAHARFSALSRTYEYVISKVRDPFATGFSWYFPRPLDVDAMNQAASVLITRHDFTSFSKLHTDVKTNLCRVMSAAWTDGDEKLVFRIRADRFLRNMVRALVGTFVEVGLGKIEPHGFNLIMESRDRNKAGYSVPAHGLFLMDIAYPDNIKPCKTEVSV